ncbi:MAG: hypothetical protein ACKO4T_06155 [Planctomycetaceae bacterium]
MAKARTPASPLDQVRSLLTAAEQKVLQSSMGATIAKATREQVEAAMKHARTLRDKWRDLHATQTRSTKRSAKAGSPVNQRTRAKHDVFDGAVKRLEARLAELAAGATAVVSGQAARLGAAKPSKPARTQKARTARAGVRSELKAAAADLTRGRGRPAAAPAVKTAMKPAAAQAAPAAASVARSAKKRQVSGRKAGAARKKSVAPSALVAQPKVGYDAAKQRSAKASAKAARLKFDGATTRRGGHVLASTKRAQARRDGRRR